MTRGINIDGLTPAENTPKGFMFNRVVDNSVNALIDASGHVTVYAVGVPDYVTSVNIANLIPPSIRHGGINKKVGEYIANINKSIGAFGDELDHVRLLYS